MAVTSQGSILAELATRASSDDLILGPKSNEPEQDISDNGSEALDDSGPDDDDFSVTSETSTVMYDHETFETFKDKVLELFREKFPMVKADDIHIQRIKGGDINRVIAVSIDQPQTLRSAIGRFLECVRTAFCCVYKRKDKRKKDLPREFILRFPRSGGDGMDIDVATLEFAGDQFDLPVARVFGSDMSTNNPIGSRYMIQERLPGTILKDILQTLNLEQKKSVVKQVCNAILALRQLTHTAGGLIDPRTTANRPYKLQVLSHAVPDFGEPECPNPVFPVEKQTVLQLMVSQCKRWSAYHQQHGIKQMAQYFDQLEKTVLSMGEYGVFDDNTFHFCHMDLHAGNVLVQVQDDHTVKVTGIIDWDFAIFAPKFACSEIPSWLWYHGLDYYESEEAINPEDAEGQELKVVFEQTVGAEYLRYAYKPEYVLAQRIYKLITSGIGSNEEIDAVQEIEDTWEKMRPAFE